MNDRQHGLGEYMMLGGNIVKGEWNKGELLKKTSLTEKDWDRKMTELESKPGFFRMDEEPPNTSKMPDIIKENVQN